MLERVKRVARELDAWLLRHHATRVGRNALVGFLRHEDPQNAGSMAYFSILSIFQLLVLAVVVLSFFVGEGDARRFVIEQIEANSPLDARTIGSVFDGIIEARGSIGLFGLIFLAWGALGVFSAANKGIGMAFAATRPRPFVWDKLLGLLLMGVTGLLGVASVVIGIATGVIQRASQDVMHSLPGGELAFSAVGFVVPLLLIFVAFLVLYRLVPNRPVTLAEVWPGAVVATLLWTVLRIGFTWYATSVANYQSAFGPISAAISLLVFLYFASVIVLLGAEVARASVFDDEEQAEVRRQAAVAAAAQPPGGPATSTRGPLPGWAMAIGGAVAGILVRLLLGRRRGG